MPHQLACVLDHDHRSVVEERDPLITLAADIADGDAHILPGHQWRPDGIGEVIQVQHLDALQPRHMPKVVIVGNDRAAILAGQDDQLIVDVLCAADVDVDDLDRCHSFLLHFVQHLEPAPALVAPHLVGRIGQQLKLVEHEVRHQQRALDEAGLAHIGDAPIDDRRGIQDVAPRLILDRLMGQYQRRTARRSQQLADLFLASREDHGAQVG